MEKENNKRNINPLIEAESIIKKHICGYIMDIEENAKNEEEIYDNMAMECSHILFESLKNKTYTPMEYSAIRNEIGKILWDIFHLYF